MEQNLSKESVQFDFSMQSEFSCMNKEKKMIEVGKMK